MKTSKIIFISIKFFVFILLFHSEVFSQTSYRSRINNGEIVEMTVKMEESVAHIIQSYVGEEDPGMWVYNLTNAEMSDDGIFTVPEEGTFWFVAFDSQEPTEMQNGGHWCYSCNTTGECPADPCAWSGGSSGGTCYCGGTSGSSSCTVERCPCDEGGGGGQNKITGGGLIIEATSIIFE